MDKPHANRRWLSDEWELEDLRVAEPIGQLDASTIPLFAGCSRRELRALDRLGCRLRVRAGATLFRQGSWPPQFVIVLDGHLIAAANGRDCETWWPGSHIGGVDVARRVPQSTTATAGSDGEILVMSFLEYETMLWQAPSVRTRRGAPKAGEARRPDEKRPGPSVTGRALTNAR